MTNRAITRREILDNARAASNRVAIDAQHLIDANRLSRLSSARPSKPATAASPPPPPAAAKSDTAKLTDLPASHHVSVETRGFANFGEQLLAVRQAAINCRYGRNECDPRLDAIERRAAAGGSESVPGEGGFLVQPEFGSAIAAKMYSTGEFLSRATWLPITQDNGIGKKIPAFDEQSRADGSRFGGVRAYWQNEADAVTAATKPKYRTMELKLRKLYAISYCTSELLQDAALLGAALELAFGNELRWKTEYACFLGTGQYGPLGILDSSNGSLIVIPKENGQGSQTIVAQNVLKMHSQLWSPSRSRAVWFINEDVEAQLFGLTVTVGTGGSEMNLFEFTDDPENQPFNTLMGRPVVPIEYLPALGSQGDLLLADPGEYYIADKGAPDVQMSMEVKFLTDEEAFRIRYRVDAMPAWHTAITPFTGSALKSPFVTLAAR